MEQEEISRSNYQPLHEQEIDSPTYVHNEKFLKIIKYINIAAGIFIAIVGLWIIVNFGVFNRERPLMSFYAFFLPFFYIVAGLLLLVAEYQKESIDIYFLFLRSFLGRGLFNIFLATQTGAGGGKFGDFFAWTLLILGCVYIFLHFITDYLKANVKQVLQILINSVPHRLI